MRVRALAAALVVLALRRGEAQVAAGPVWEWLRPRTTLRTSAWSSSRTEDDRGPLFGSVLWLDVAPRLTSWLEFHASVRAGVGSALPAGDKVDLREGYAKVAVGGLELRAGSQIFAWGRTDALNPTDNLSPRDFRLLTPDDADMKWGTPSVQLSAPVGSITVTAAWLAGFHGNELPLAVPPPTLSPSRTAEQGAVRVERAGGQLDWSVSYFHGLDLAPDIAVQGSGTASALILEHHPINVLGGDLATTLGRFGVRAEAAWVRTADVHGDNPQIKNSSLYAIAGADRTFGEYLNVNLQILVRRVLDFGSRTVPSDSVAREAALLLDRVSQQQRSLQTGFTLRVSDRWFHETLSADVSTVLLAPLAQVLVRPRVSYAVTDRWQLITGADLYDGARGTLFADLMTNSLGFLEVRFGL